MKLSQTPHNVLIFGASGLVGSCLLERLLADPLISQVHSLGRRALTHTHPKLVQHMVDLSTTRTLPSAIPAAAAAYICLGTTIKQAGSKAAFRAVDYTAVVHAAHMAQIAGVQQLAVVSAPGASPHAPFFYARVKGEMEAAVAQMQLPYTVFVRPSLITGNRAALGQPVRAGEALAERVLQLLAPVLPLSARAISADAIAQAMHTHMRAAHAARGIASLSSAAMQRMTAT